MPAHRYWEIEDSQVNFAGIEAGSTDIVRMLLTDFALIYGDDWFVVPFSAQVGSLVTENREGPRHLRRSTDVTPRSATSPPTGHQPWSM